MTAYTNGPWGTDIDVTPADETTLALQNASFVLWLKDFLIAEGWSLVETCDSTATSGTDLLVDEATDFVWAAGANPHSWFTIRSPEGFIRGLDGTGTGTQSRIWLTVSCNNANTYNLVIRLHEAAPTGVSTTATPSSTAQLVWSAQQFSPTSLTSALFHGAVGDNGSFWVGISHPTAGYMDFGFMVISTVDFYTQDGAGNSDPYPLNVYASAAYLASGRGAFTLTTIGGTTASRGWYVTTANTIAAANTVGLASEQMVGVTTSTAGTVPNTGNAYNARQDSAVLRAWSTGTGQHVLLGRLEDIQAGSANLTAGTMEPNTPPLTHTLLGGIWLPADAAPTL